MDLIGYLRLLRRRWWIILLAIVVCLGSAIGATRLEHPRYTASTRVLVSGSSSIGAGDEMTRRSLANQRAVVFSQIVTADPVINAAVAAAAAQQPGAGIDLGGVVASASASGSNPFLTISVTARSAAAAKAVADSYPTVLPTQLAALDQVPSAIEALLTVVTPAALPTSPSSPQLRRNALIGLVLGIVLGIAAALMRELLDTRLRDSDEVRRLIRTPILGVIPREFPDELLPAATRPHSRRSEAYRGVRTNLELAAGDTPPRSFAVISPGQGEGKSSTAANLALLYSRAGKRVAVVDADLRKPRIAQYFNADPDRGLSEVLGRTARLSDVLQPVSGESITVLTSGPVVQNPSELIGSEAMRAVLLELRADFDVVIVDTPPVLPVTDALLVGVHTDGMVVVVRTGSTTRSALSRSIEAVERVKGRLLGVVVNASVEVEDRRYGYGPGYVSQDESTAGVDIRPAVGERVEEVHLGEAEGHEGRHEKG